ncbi:MAG: DUF2442 domain-containing protein [Pedobacter sp.]|nr:MAG: DUF2442 domain-containing protein [Pedobacter sp.]
MGENTRAKDKGEKRKNHQKNVNLQVVTAKWIEGYKIQIGFNDVSQQLVDFGPYLATHSHPYIDPYKELDQFKTFHIDRGNLVWGEDWDMIFPTWKLHRGYL